MMTLQNLRSVVIYQSTSLTNGATGTSATLDTRPKGKKYDEIRIDVISTTSNDATNVPSTLKVQECDTDTATSFVDVVAFTGATATSTSAGYIFPAMPTNTATNPQPYVSFHIDTRKRKRYLRMLVSPVTTQTFTILATLGACKELSVAQADYNSGLLVIG